ncbi:conserved hypothetical protein [Trichinella spiralis]|uniref:hypothetical protein n=1 Tax=Trichinella spiralis TaxID=6334 RepID=UPI0001EFD71B|nr:conserved hypothetical protein [Trichinella spiralis]
MCQQIHFVFSFECCWQISNEGNDDGDDDARHGLLLALVCLLRYCQLSEFRRMAASEAATVIGQFYCATVSPPAAAS